MAPKMERLLDDVAYYFGEEDRGRVAEIINAFLKLREHPLSPINPGRGRHAVLILIKRFGNVERRVAVSLEELKTLSRYSYPPYAVEIPFHVGRDTVYSGSIGGSETVFIGEPRMLERVERFTGEVLRNALLRPREIIVFRNQAYLTFPGARYVSFDFTDGIALAFSNVSEMDLVEIFDDAILRVDELFSRKNKAMYKLIFLTALQRLGAFERFFHRYVRPHMTPEQVDFLNEMHSERNFLTLLHSNLIRVGFQTVPDEIGILVRRRAVPYRPLEIGIIFGEGGIEVSGRASNVLVDFMV
ncbi:hypothetical protein [Palaeococcus ferrophilus]|uniref:hypothetical protein n=1 Tax=Palaeococcus ferrophilus TaxID=83868 RepID=UPI00064EED17|nr:hypothetical protein [Palaeococcus ferrophilus]